MKPVITNVSIAYPWQKPNGFEIASGEVQFLPPPHVSPEILNLLDEAQEMLDSIGRRLVVSIESERSKKVA